MSESLGFNLFDLLLFVYLRDGKLLVFYFHWDSIVTTLMPLIFISDAAGIVAELPPYESLLGSKYHDKVKRHILESIKPGDIIYASILRGRSGSLKPLIARPLCTDESKFKILRDYKIKVNYFKIYQHKCL